MNFIKDNHYLVIAFVLFIGFSFLTIKNLTDEVTYAQIIVTEGDTLWAYSKEYAEGIPVEQWIDEVIKVNQLTSTTIKIGEKLKIPVSPDKMSYNQIATNSVEETE